ncbi:peptidoglycan bridge formation glycyltransferase FemA/FemB family protein [Arcanobacterium haemolyticum]|nr:peptidoglycan bridge formation glycyltransferase FemA/FemB family protein [Arcanobacterium haemolyticum]
MQFSILNADQYAHFAATAPRIFIPQLPEYAQVRQENGMKSEFVGVIDAGNVIAAAIVTYQPWKKLFSRAHIVYGPTLDWTNSAVINCFFNGLISHLHSQQGVVALRFNPLLARAFYDDITKVADNPIASSADAQLRSFGASRLTKEFYDQADIQIRYIYTKDISGKSFEEATSTLSKSLRRRFHNEGRYGVEVRFLEPHQFEVFDSLHESTQERTSMAGISTTSRRIYEGLMEHLGPDRAFLSVAYFSPRRYMKQIDDEVANMKVRLEELEKRPDTKARQREMNQITQRFDGLADQRKRAEEVLDEHGDDIPFNAALSFVVGNELLLLLGGMDKRFVEFGRDYPVERAMFKWACDHNLDTYNTFGISGIFDETAPDFPVLRFKRSLNGKVEEFVGTYVIPVRPFLAKVTNALQ